MKFDVVLGNPPYQDSNKVSENRKNTNKPLWYLFVEAIPQLITERGTVAFVTPTSWIQPTSLIHKSIASKKLTYVKVYNKSPFNVGTTTSYWIQAPNGADKVEFATDTDSTIIKLQHHEMSLLPVKTTNFLLALSILKKLVTDGASIPAIATTFHHSHSKPTIVRRDKDRFFCYPVFHTHQQTLWTNTPNELHGLPKVIVSKTGTFNKTYYDEKSSISQGAVALLVKDSTEGNNLINLLQQNVYKFINDSLRAHSTVPTPVLKNLPMVDLSRSWTDEELYKHFNLTLDEIKLIEETIK